MYSLIISSFKLNIAAFDSFKIYGHGAAMWYLRLMNDTTLPMKARKDFYLWCYEYNNLWGYELKYFDSEVLYFYIYCSDNHNNNR